MDNEYITKSEFYKAIKELEHHFDIRFEIVENRLSEKLSNRINDTYWKIVPIVLGLMTLVNGIFFIAYKMG